MAFLSSRHFRARSGDLVTLRTAQPDDAAALIAYVLPRLQEDEFYILLPEELDKTEEQERQWIQDHLEAPGQVIVVAEASGAPVGMLNFENGTRKRLAHRGSFGISVAPPWRRQGIGTALLKALIEWGKTNPQIEKICLSVYAANHGAIRLYRKLGFAEEGRRPRELKLGPGRYADDILMYRFVDDESAPDAL